MKTKLAAISALISLATPVLFAHRIDEYLQAIIVSAGPKDLQASMRLIPGVAVSNSVIAAIDSNGDGVFSASEQRAYAQKVLHDLALSVDGESLTPRLADVSFPSAAEMKEGLGEIRITFVADLPSRRGQRALVIENHHEPRMSVYLMNCLVPQESSIRIVAQNRNENQSYYRVDYMQSSGEQDSWLTHWQTGLLSAMSPLSGVPSMFRLGMRHIAEGTDHLLFLLALLLPAPLLAVGSRWATHGSVRYSLMQIVRVVTAFTIGHSLTLALGASGLVSLASRLVEVLIAFSILVSAVHALRPLFPGREPMIATFFGLVHGLAFATTLQNLGVNPWQRIAGILGFNLGIESMQLLVVASILPSLLILSRMPVYRFFRFAGASFAGIAALGWIAERLLGVHTDVDAMVDGVARHGVWLAAALFATSLILWLNGQSAAVNGNHANAFLNPAGLSAGKLVSPECGPRRPRSAFVLPPSPMGESKY